jgi:hypothetical protein
VTTIKGDEKGDLLEQEIRLNSPNMVVILGIGEMLLLISLALSINFLVDAYKY